MEKRGVILIENVRETQQAKTNGEEKANEKEDWEKTGEKERTRWYFSPERRTARRMSWTEGLQRARVNWSQTQYDNWEHGDQCERSTLRRHPWIHYDLPRAREYSLTSTWKRRKSTLIFFLSLSLFFCRRSPFVGTTFANTLWTIVTRDTCRDFAIAS